jgi:mevalonate kinase
MISKASGKFILTGEHFILYGCPALALPWRDACLSLEEGSPEGDYAKDPRLTETWQDARRRLGLPKTEGFPFRMTSSIPLGSGFGSSAALCVALLRAAAKEAHQMLDEETLIREATALEALFHGRSSGLDPAVVVHQQPLRFVMGSPPQPWSWRLRGLGFILAVSREQRQTAAAVACVRRFTETHPTRFAAMLEEMKQIVQRIQEACQSDTPDAMTQEALGREIGEALLTNHALLTEMGVSSAHLDTLVEVALQHGAWGAKLTGAGQGGGMLALAPNHRLPALADALTAAEARTTQIYHPLP